MRLTKKTNKNDYYIPVKKGMLMAGYVDKLGEYEDIDESPEHLKITKIALDVIKEKRVNLSIILDLFAADLNVETYNSMIKSRKMQMATFPPYELTQKEYGLLKGVLYEKETSEDRHS